MLMSVETILTLWNGPVKLIHKVSTIHGLSAQSLASVLGASNVPHTWPTGRPKISTYAKKSKAGIVGSICRTVYGLPLAESLVFFPVRRAQLLLSTSVLYRDSCCKVPLLYVLAT